LLIPISHDDLRSRRWPWVTIAIILLNVLVFAFTLRAEAQQKGTLEAVAVEALTYYVDHPYLEMPPPLDAAVPRLMADKGYGPKIREGRALRVPAFVRAEEQQELDRLCAVVTEARTPAYLRLFAYVPSRNNWVGLVTSQFLHGGFLHVFFNMWFLWLVGVNMEDRWGRLIFPVFYVSAGIVACLAHKLYAPASTVPMIGASGAVAGAMGAFLIGFGRTRIRFLWLLWIRPFLFHARAYLMLPLWAAMQVLNAVQGHGRGDGAGVAYAAHVGGFLFGVVFAVGMRVTGAEKRVDEAIENDGAVLQDPRILRAAALTDAGDPRGAIRLLDEAAGALPSSIDVQLELLRAARAAGDEARERASYGRLIGLYLREGMGSTAIELHAEMEASGRGGGLAPGLRLRVAQELERAGHTEGAAAAFAKIHAAGVQDQIALTAVLGHARVLVRLHRREEAQRLYAEARRYPDPPPALAAELERGARAAEELGGGGIALEL
jgi:membrane associated rhomboid family serine protease